MSNLMTADELCNILAVAHAPEEDVELAPGHTVTVGGASSAEWIAHIVRPNPSVRRTFTMGAREELAMAQGIERANNFDLASYLDENIESGPEVKACMGALFLRKPGNEQVKATFMRMGAAAQTKILSAGGRQTWAKDPAGFFAQVGRELAGLDAVVADSLQDPAAEAKPNRSDRRKAAKLAA
jgi:hypothetical protein